VSISFDCGRAGLTHNNSGLVPLFQSMKLDVIGESVSYSLDSFSNFCFRGPYGFRRAASACASRDPIKLASRKAKAQGLIHCPGIHLALIVNNVD
jgi:hypothetical protein